MKKDILDYKMALSKCMKFCSRAEYCAFDIKKKMQLWEINASDQENILVVLYEEKFLNDERYIQAFVKDKFRFNRWGKVKIAYMLKQKQLGGDSLSSALNEIDDEAYFDLIKEELNKKLRSTKGKDEYDIKSKVVRYLVSKGFETEFIYTLYKEQINND